MPTTSLVPPLAPTVIHRVRYTDKNGFSRVMVGHSRAELEAALEQFVLEGRATFVGAVFTESTK